MTKKRHSEILGREKNFPSPPNSAPGLRHCPHRMTLDEALVQSIKIIECDELKSWNRLEGGEEKEEEEEEEEEDKEEEAQTEEEEDEE